MSTEVENRVVDMKFNNSAFEAGVAKTMGTLDALKSKLNFTGAAKGLNDLDAAGSRFSLGGLAKNVDDITHRFSLMNVAGVAAVANIANKAVNAGISLVKSFTINPITDGFTQYQQQINATQTILGNVAQNGSTLGDVTKTLGVLNEYANKTIYNFSDMATNLGTFTSAGVKLGPASEAIQGLSNVAAAAGAGTQQAAGAMYQLSQALGRGKLQAQDWNSVVAAGMASSNFKTAILETAKSIGTLKIPKTESVAEWEKAGGSFQDAMSKGQITSKVLIQTLQVMTGNLTDAQLAAKGYTKEQIKSLQAMAKQAADSAKNIKTVAALTDNLKQGVGSAYANVFKTLVGSLPDATRRLTYLSTILNRIFVDPVNRLNVFIGQFAKLGGVSHTLHGLRNVFVAIGAILKPIGQAFRDIFPPASAKALADLATKFAKFTHTLIISKSTAEHIRKTFDGVFTVLKLGIGIVAGIGKGVFSLFHLFGSAIPAVFSLTSTIGSLVTKLGDLLQNTTVVQKFFGGLASGISYARLPLVPLVKFIGLMADALNSLINGDMQGFSIKFQTAFSSIGDIFGTVVDSVTGKVKLIQKVLDYIGNFLSNFGASAASSTSGFVRSLGSLATTVGKFIGEFSAGAASKVVDLLDSVSESVRNLFKNLSFKFDFGGFSSGIDSGTKSLSKLSVVGDAVSKIWTGLAHAFTKVGDVVGPAASTIGQIFQSILDKVKEYISGLSFQDAIALLNTGFLIAIYHSFNNFLKGVNGVTKSLSQVFKSASGTLNQLTGSLKTMQNSVRSKIVERIAIAVGILAAAVYVLSTIDSKKLKIALGALAALFVQLIGALAIFSKVDQKGLLASGGAMVLLAGAIFILAGAIKIISTMSVADLKKGIAVIAVLLTSLAVFAKAASGARGVFAAAAGMLILSFALIALAGAIKLYSKIDFNTFGKGLLLVAITIAAIGLAFRTFPHNVVKNAAALVIISGALLILSKVLKVYGAMSIGSIAKSLIELGLSLAILVVAVLALQEGEAGVAVMLLMALALKILVPQLVALGKMSIGQIAKSLITLVLAFVIIAAASVLLVEAVPFIAAFGAALLILGVAMLAFGAGAYLLATAFTLMVAVGTTALAAFLQLLPVFATQVGLAILAFAKVIGDGAPALEKAFVAIINGLLDGINKISQKLIDVVAELILKLVDKITELTPKFVTAGLEMLTQLLIGIDANIYQITSRGVKIITKFLKAIGDNSPLLIQQAFVTMLQFINGITDAINLYAPQLQAAGGRMALAIADGLTGGLASKAVDVAKGAAGLGKKAYNSFMGSIGAHSPSRLFMKSGGFIVDGIVIGMNNASGDIDTAAQKLGKTALDGMNKSISDLHDAFNTNVNLNPVIAPVIDLTAIREGAAQMSSLLAANPVTANVSLDQAKSVSTDANATLQAQFDASSQPPVVKELKFEQTNISPEPLSTVEIYRRTNNQFALAKAALGVPA